MKRYLVLFGCSLLFFCAPVAAQVEPADQAAQAQPEAAGVLPDNPTREQCEVFVNELRTYTTRNVGAELSKLATTRMGSIPVEHIGVLTQILAENGPRESKVRDVLEQFDPESYRKVVVDGLSQDPSYIFLIALNGWYQDAKEDILAKFKAVDPKVAAFDPIWFQAFLEVIEPEHYPLVHEMVLSLYDLGNRLQLLETLPDYDFAKTVNACWENAKQPDENGKERTAIVLAFMRDRPVKVTDTLRPYAIRTGQIDAFDPLIEQLNPDRGLVSRRGETLTKTALNARLTLRRHLDFNGTNEEIQAWFRTHRDQLVFNPFTQRFELPED